MVRIVERSAKEHEIGRVSRVVLEIGQFSGVEVHALQQAFSALCPGTVMEGAHIEYLTPCLLLFCEDCQNEYLAGGDDLCCPACEGSNYKVRQGRELLVKSIQAEEA